MINSANFYTPLAVKSDFNALVRHIKSVLQILDDCDVKSNIADQLYTLLCNKQLQNEQVPALLSVLLLDMWKYSVASSNIKTTPQNVQHLIDTVSTWKGVDIVLGYHHPILGFSAINPKNPANLATIEGFKKHELLVVYVGKQDKGPLDPELAHTVIEGIFNLLNNKKTVIPDEILKGPFAFVEEKKKEKKIRTKKTEVGKKRSGVAKTEAKNVAEENPLARPAVRVPTGSIRMSQLISVPVSNELFHNGNVEAWKRIIRSYNAKYPNCEVILFYDGEKIVDINTLFKWGKVKHGSVIQFAVSGEEIKELSKLSKYFKEGASPRFEVFLKGSPDTVLNLF